VPVPVSSALQNSRSIGLLIRLLFRALIFIGTGTAGKIILSAWF
jgi:hypothetical protein